MPFAQKPAGKISAALPRVLYFLTIFSIAAFHFLFRRKNNAMAKHWMQHADHIVRRNKNPGH